MKTRILLSALAFLAVCATVAWRWLHRPTGTGIPSNQITFCIVVEPGLGRYTLQTSTDGIHFANVTTPVDVSSDGLNWTRASADVTVNASADGPEGLRLIRVYFSSIARRLARVSTGDGASTVTYPDPNPTKAHGSADKNKATPEPYKYSPDGAWAGLITGDYISVISLTPDFSITP